MPKSILVVDDNLKSLAALAEALEHAGYDPLVLQFADDPVTQFGMVKPELVFLSLKEGKALALCEGIRDNPDGAIVPIIFVGSGTEAVRSPSDALTQGGDYYFAEPLDLTKVLAKVQTYVGVGSNPVELDAPSPSDEPAPAPGMAPLATSLEPPFSGADARPTLRGEALLGEVTVPITPEPMGDDPTRVPTDEPRKPLPGLPDFAWEGAGERPSDDTVLSTASDDLLAKLKANEPDNTDRQPALEEPESTEDEPAADAESEGATDEDTARLREEAELEEKLAAQRQADEAAMRRAEEEAREREAEEARARAEAKRKADEEARRQAEEEIRRQAEEEAREAAEQARKLEEAARAKAEADAAARREAEEEIRRQAEEEARERAEEEAHARAEAEARRQAEEEARHRAEETLRKKTEEETRRRVEEETRRRAEEEHRRQVEEDARRKADEELRRKTEEELRRKTEAELRRKTEEELRRKADEEARRKTEEELRRKADEEARRKTDEEARRRAEEEAKRRADEEEQQKAQEEARREAELQRQVDAEVRRKLSRSEAAADTRVEPVRKQTLPVEQAPAPPTPHAWDEPAVAVKNPRPGGLAPLAALAPAEGNFAGGQDIAWLMHEVWRQQVTGRIDFTSESRKKTLFIERGGPVDAYSSQVFDRMEEFLYREGKITRAQYQDVRVKALRNPRKIGAYLVSEGSMKPEELFACVRGYLMQVVFGLFEWEAGSYKYLTERVEEDDRITLDVDPRALISEGIRRKYLIPRLMKRVGAPKSLLVPRADVSLDADALGLSADERQVVRLLDGTRSIEDLVFSTGLSAQRVYQVLVMVVTAGWAEVRVRGIEGVDEDGTSAGDDIDRRRIQEKVEQVRKLDYFQILGVPQAATAYEIDRAYDRALSDYKLERFSEAVRRDLGEELLEIARVLDDAREVLKNDALRDAYARHLP